MPTGSFPPPRATRKTTPLNDGRFLILPIHAGQMNAFVIFIVPSPDGTGVIIENVTARPESMHCISGYDIRKLHCKSEELHRFGLAKSFLLHVLREVFVRNIHIEVMEEHFDLLDTIPFGWKTLGVHKMIQPIGSSGGILVSKILDASPVVNLKKENSAVQRSSFESVISFNEILQCTSKLAEAIHSKRIPLPLVKLSSKFP
jgi:hypothetical protein